MTLEQLAELWKEFEDTPVIADEHGEVFIDSDFHIWKKGTSREDIWHWFDNHCPNGLVADLM